MFAFGFSPIGERLFGLRKSNPVLCINSASGHATQYYVLILFINSTGPTHTTKQSSFEEMKIPYFNK